VVSLGAPDEEFVIVHERVTKRTEGDEIIRSIITALTPELDMVNGKIIPVQATRIATAPSIAVHHLSAQEFVLFRRKSQEHLSFLRIFRAPATISSGTSLRLIFITPELPSPHTGVYWVFPFEVVEGVAHNP